MQPHDRSIRGRWIGLVTAAVLCAVVGACNSDTPIGADAQNDSSTGFIVEVHIILYNWAVTGSSFEVPAHTKGHLMSESRGGPNQPGSTAVLYTLDCARVAELDIQGDRALVYIDAEGQASALAGTESVPQVSPAATEGHFESVTGCSKL
jgi:hypothetical protein